MNRERLIGDIFVEWSGVPVSVRVYYLVSERGNLYVGGITAQTMDALQQLVRRHRLEEGGHDV